MSKRNGAATGGPVKADENENVAAYRAKSGGLLLQVNTEEVKPYFVKLSFSSNDVSWTKSSSDCLIESVWLQDRPAIKNIPNAHPPRQQQSSQGQAQQREQRWAYYCFSFSHLLRFFERWAIEHIAFFSDFLSLQIFQNYWSNTFLTFCSSKSFRVTWFYIFLLFGDNFDQFYNLDNCN